MFPLEKEISTYFKSIFLNPNVSKNRVGLTSAIRKLLICKSKNELKTD